MCKRGSELNVLNIQLYIQDLGGCMRAENSLFQSTTGTRQSDDTTAQSAVNSDHLKTLIHLYVNPKSLLATLSQQLPRWKGEETRCK